MSSIVTTPIERIRDSNRSSAIDILTVEEPLEIHLSYFNGYSCEEKNISVTMRTPGNDEELALGFLFTEGIIHHYSQVKSIRSIHENCITVELNDDVKFEISKLEKHFYTSSSCGVCGKTSIEAIHTITKPVNPTQSFFHSSLIISLPQLLRNSQSVFEKTGGLHASALFDNEGELILLREDVGRHNALDKIIGASLKNISDQLPEFLLMLSGRASFELIQKATMAGISFVAAVGAPSSLAVELARSRDMTLIGFLREDRYNVYCGGNSIIH